jgi:hypothetical protein
MIWPFFEPIVVDAADIVGLRANDQVKRIHRHQP